MAVIHKATLTPGKLDVIRGWVPSQPWADGIDAESLETAGSYRFDDPDDEVGLEVFLVAASDGTTLQVPLTYRAAEYSDAREGFVATMDHSVLGKRWAYDGCCDPVFVTALVRTMMTGGHGAVIEFPTGEIREQTTSVTGSGSADAAAPSVTAVDTRSDDRTTTMVAGDLEVRLARRIGSDVSGRYVLTGSWPGQDDPVTLAALR